MYGRSLTAVSLPLAPSLFCQSGPAGGAWHFPRYLKENLLPNTLDPWLCCSGEVQAESTVPLTAEATC